MNMSSAVDLALVVIARNEMRCIARCLNSAKAHVDRMVVLDTGSSDDTIRVANACGAEVFTMNWPGDFSKARNHALACAGAAWHLVIDADEWIESGTECLRSFISLPDALGVVCVQNQLNNHDQLMRSSTWVSRLLPRGVFYEGAIHEQPVSDLSRVRLPLVLGHDGYTPQQNQQKKGRNRQLLEAALKNHPDAPYLWYQLGKDFEVYGECRQAINCYEKALSLLQQKTAYSHDLTVRTLHCMGQAGLLTEAIALAQDWMPDWLHSPDFFFVLGNLWLDWAIQNPASALKTGVPMARLAWEQCLVIGEQPELDGSVRGRGSFLAQRNLQAISDSHLQKN